MLSLLTTPMSSAPMSGLSTCARRMCATARAACALGLISLGLAAAPVHADEFTLPPPERYVLANGLEVILSLDTRQRAVAVLMRYDVGSRDDPEGYAGLAHMVEHMTFRGSRHVAPLEMLSLLERMGAQGANAATHPDWTSYFAVVPASQLPVVLWLESERMGFTLEAMTKAGFALERDVVLSERRERAGAGSRVPSFVSAALYPEGHPYRTVGTDETDEAAFALDDVRWFYQQWYRPDNATLTLVGSFDPARVKAAIEQYFGPIRAVGARPRRRPAEPVELAGIAELHVALPARRDTVQISWIAPCGVWECGQELFAMEALLTGTSEAALRRALVGESALASDVYLGIDPYDTHTRITIEADVALDVDAARVRERIDEVLARLQSTPVSAGELRAARVALATELTAGFEPLASRAYALAHFRAPGRSPDLYDPDAQLRKIDALTPNDLMAAFQRYLPLGRRVILYERRGIDVPGEGMLQKVVGQALSQQEATAR
jgi:zinc protease